MDRLTKEQRHKNMVANKSHGTKIEIMLAKVLWNAGIRYRKNDKGIHGTPDFSIRGQRIAIFCDGEFWHGKDWETNKKKIKSNRTFWYTKIERNIQRDQQITRELEFAGWTVFRFWETEIRMNADACVNQVLACIENKKSIKNKITPIRISADQKIPVQLKPGQQLSVVSHFLYNQDDSSVSPFEKPAKAIIGKLYDVDEQNSAFENLVAEPQIQYSLGSNLHTAPFLPQKETTFTFVDLFAGIGGIRLALQELGGRCVFCSEWNTQAQYNYLLNFGEVPFGDITDESTQCLIPNKFDLLCGSIPSQKFTFTSKKSNLEKMRGTLFYYYASILKDKRPKAFLLETDPDIFIKDKGKSLDILIESLRKDLGYKVLEAQSLNALDFDLPHNTERVYFMGYQKQYECETLPEWKNTHINNPLSDDCHTSLQHILENQPVPASYYLSEQVMNTLARHKDKSAAECKPWKYEAAPCNGILHVLQGLKLNHKHNFVIDHRLNDSTPPATYKGTPNKKGIRKLTPREMARLQGFPDNFILDAKDETIYKLLENASPITMTKVAAKIIIEIIGALLHKR